MFCIKCGKRLENHAKFCIFCGAVIDPDSDSETIVPEEFEAYPPIPPLEAVLEPPPAKKKRKRTGWVVMLIVLLLISLLAAGAYVVYQNPAVQIYLALKAENPEQAYEIFYTDYHKSTLPDFIVEELIAYATSVQDDYVAGEITSEEVEAIYRILQNFPVEEFETVLQEIEAANEAQGQLEQLLSNAQQAYDAASYTIAMDLYEETLSRFGDSQEAKDGLARATEAHIGQLLDSAKMLHEHKNYSSAVNLFNSVLKLDEENQDAINGREKSLAAMKTQYLEKLANALDSDDSKAAYEALSVLQKHFPDDPDIQEAAVSIETYKFAGLQEDVQTIADGGNWDGALELLDTYQKQYPEFDGWQDFREEIIWKRPVSLLNLTTVNSEHIDLISSVVEDRWGNVYDGAVGKWKGYSDGFALYNLKKDYTRLTATVFCPDASASYYEFSVSFYLDEKLVHHVGSITVETPPVPIDIDVTGATTMRIVISGNGYGSLYVAESNLEKVKL